MVDNKNSFDYKGRNLSEVFKELEGIRNNSINEQTHIKEPKNTKEPKKPHNAKSNKLNSKKFEFNLPTFNFSQIKSVLVHNKLICIMLACSIIAVCVALFFARNVFAESSSSNKVYYEVNDNALDMKSIIIENANASTYKEQSAVERDVDFDILYQDNATLPKGEQVIKQPGVVGKDKITSVKTYENQKLVEEVLVSSERIQEPVPQIVDVGTSEFLSKLQVHVGDTLYLTKACSLKESANNLSRDIAQMKRYLDVKLLELTSEEWCKISYNNNNSIKEGYVQTSSLTSAIATPTITEKCRIQKILQGVNEKIPLNKPSNLTLDDYKHIFTGLSSDKNKVFENNYTAFYNAEKNYKVNGIFLASLAIHESAWGTSQISREKNNLFGYGAYDRNPFEYSYDFKSYSEGIDTVAKVMAKYYLNPPGTKIYDNETAQSTYYNGPTLEDVNKKYSTDQGWHTKVYNYMEQLYDKLKSLL